MIDLEERLRGRLDAAAATQGVPPDFDDRVANRVSVRRRRRTVGRGVLVTVVLAAIVGAAVAVRDEGPSSTTVTGVPGETSTGATATGWHPIADAPIPPRFQALSIVMGNRVLVWGGSDDQTRLDGAVYDAADDTWQQVPASPLTSGDAVGAWTGREAIVLSGDPRHGVVAAAYDPESNVWRTLAAPPLTNGASATNHAVWTGSELVVVGVAGEDEGEGGTVNQVAIYDPATDRWRTGALPAGPLPIFGDAVWTGTEVVVAGSVGESGRSVGNNTLRAYDPAADRWRQIPWGLDGVRGRMVVAWTGSRLFVGGGRDRDLVRRDGALVDLATGVWDRVPDAPVPFEGNLRFGELWTGTAVLTLSGEGSRPVTFDPAIRTWDVGPASPVDGGRQEVSWAWVASERAVVVWSGGSSFEALSSSTTATSVPVHSASPKIGTPGITGCCTPIAGGERYTPGR